MAEERQVKQEFLCQEILGKGYDQAAFEQVCEERHGTDVDNWSFEELQTCVREFQQAQDAVRPYSVKCLTPAPTHLSLLKELVVTVQQ